MRSEDWVAIALGFINAMQALGIAYLMRKAANGHTPATNRQIGSGEGGGGSTRGDSPAL